MNSRKMFYVACLGVVFCFAVSAIHADTIAFTTAGTDSGQSNFNSDSISLHPGTTSSATLPGSSWVSFADTTNSANDSGHLLVPTTAAVDFYYTFDISGTPVAGTLTTAAGDTTSVSLNGTLLASGASSTGGCSTFAIGCFSSTGLTTDLSANLFTTGQNTVEFSIEAPRGRSYGDATSEDATPIPEPGALLMLCSGILSLAAVTRKKMLQF